MATAAFTLTVPTFPVGTAVKAYPSTNWPTPDLPSGAPTGSATQEKTVSSEGKAAFTGLTVGTAYWAVAEVGGVYRYVKMLISQGTEVTGIATGTLKSLITALAAEGLITDGTTES